jgi:hypothetical protein
MFQTKDIEESKTNILCPLFKNRSIFELLWKNIVELGRPQMAIIHVEYTRLQTHTLGICNTAFLLQTWLHEYGSVTHIACVAVSCGLENRCSICGSGRVDTSFQTTSIHYYSGINPTSNPIITGCVFHRGHAARV